MPIEGFNYEDFSKNLAQQASGVIPTDIDETSKSYIINLVFNYCMLAGEALDKDTTISLNAQQACIICQFIGEWTFHKAIDIIRSNLPLEVRDETMQKVAFTVFEIAKLAIIKDLPMPQTIGLVEQHVKKAFDDAIADLTSRGAINDAQANNAVNQSNIDEMAKQQQAEESGEYQNEPQSGKPESNKILKLASLALLMQKLPPDKIKSITKKFNEKDANLLIQYIDMPDLQSKLDSTIAIKCLKEIRANMPQTKSLNTGKLATKLNSIVKSSDKKKLAGLVQSERDNVKRIISSTGDSNLPPHITAVLCSYLEEKAHA